MIEIFVKSSSRYVDIGSVRETSSHVYCAPGSASSFIKNVESRFKGRILSPEDQRMLELMGRFTNKFQCEVKIYDLSSMKGKIRAIRRGVRRTPTVIINGSKYEGLEKILELLNFQDKPRKHFYSKV